MNIEIFDSIIKALIACLLSIILFSCIFIRLNAGNAVYATWSIPPKPTSIVYFDLYTRKGGIGLGAYGGEFVPNEEITLYVNMTSNGYPVCNRTILFEIEGPTNFFISTAVTNASGVASQTLIIEENGIGKWSVTAQTGLDEDTYGDSLDFEVITDHLPEFPALSMISLIFILTAIVTLISKKSPKN